MGGSSPDRGAETQGPQDRLESWKAIAAYLKRDVTTAQRWERREQMPVHRHLHDKQGSVYAYRSELDTWWEHRRTETGPTEGTAGEPTVAPEVALQPVSDLSGRNVRRRWLVGSAGAVLVGALLAYWIASERNAPDSDPLRDARVTQLTDLTGTEQAATISRDGRYVAFLAENEGHTDAWITEVGTARYRNVTQGNVPELINPSIRTLGFSPDGKLVTIWSRKSDGSRSGDINILSAPVEGGALQTYLPDAAEVAWSSDGRRLVYHTTAPGDPLFVKDSNQGTAHQVYVAPAGVHCHFPVWSPDDAYIYFARGVPPDHWDIWRIRPSGDGLERITSHDSWVSHPVLLDRHTLVYLASDAQRSGPWFFAIDVDRRVSHRINFGLERYTSLAASLDGTRLVATATRVRSSLSRLSVASVGAPVVPLTAAGASPRVGPDYLVYVSAVGGRQGVWKLVNGAARELWGTNRLIIVGAPSIAPDGRWIAFTAADGKKTSLWVMNSNGEQARVLTQSLVLRGNLAWAPDGKSVVGAVMRDGEPRLTKIPLDGSPPTTLVSEYSLDPTWSPDGRFLLYSGPDVGTTFAVRAVAADGRPYALPALILSRGARRMVVSRDGRSVVILRGDVSHKNFWLVDLQTGAERQLGELGPELTIGDFDVSRNGDEIVFDRNEETSAIALIERTH
ncbi:MAG TPA: hypothetical protein VGM84_05995 [Steroidobacteraceae bacterium]|jgi:Tol biopolymer transport system component